MESIAVAPSAYVTVHVISPHYVSVRPPELIAEESSHFNFFFVSRILYDKAGVANLVVLIVSVSVKHGLVTKMLKFCVLKTVGSSV